MKLLMRTGMPFLTFIFSLGIKQAHAQVAPPVITKPGIEEGIAPALPVVKKLPPVLDSNAIHYRVDVLPRFRGDIHTYINSVIHYPETAKRNNIKGKVIAEFVINKQGKVQDVKIVRSLSPECDEEVRRLCEKMPDWKPGLIDGKPVNVGYILPVTFY